jgi:GT2 family glycosyltransferase
VLSDPATTLTVRETRSSSAPTVGVLVTNYNTWTLLRRCLDAVRRHEPRLDEILVVDDASDLPAPDLAEGVRLVRNQSRSGLVASLNRGLRLCRSDIVVILDSDAYPATCFREETELAFARQPETSIVGMPTVREDGSASGWCEREPDVWTLLLGQRLDALRSRFHGRRSSPINVFTCAMAVRRDAILSFGGFDERYDWLDLDHDICMAARRAGQRVGALVNARVVHEGGGAPQGTSDRVWRFYKNRWYLLRKFGKIRWPRLVRALLLTRLALERLFVFSAGALLWSPAVRRDKARGRTNAFRWLRENAE